MIRTKHKIYGEPNDPRTVVFTDSVFTGTYLVVGTGNKGIRRLQVPRNSILISNTGDGQISYLTLGPNQVIGTDAEGNIVALSRSEVGL